MDFDITGMLDGIMKGMDNRKFVVGKSVPASKEQKAKYRQLHAMVVDLGKELGRFKALRNQWWADIELSINDFGNKRYNEEIDEIEIEERSDAKKKGVKSPY